LDCFLFGTHIRVLMVKVLQINTSNLFRIAADLEP